MAVTLLQSMGKLFSVFNVFITVKLDQAYSPPPPLDSINPIINGHKFPGIQQISILQHIGNKQPHVQ